jgi:hypothetical protein
VEGKQGHARTINESSLSGLLPPAPSGYLRFRIFGSGRDIAASTRFRDDGPAGRNRRLVNAKTILIEKELKRGAELHRALLQMLGD